MRKSSKPRDSPSSLRQLRTFSCCRDLRLPKPCSKWRKRLQHASSSFTRLFRRPKLRGKLVKLAQLSICSSRRLLRLPKLGGKLDRLPHSFRHSSSRLQRLPKFAGNQVDPLPPSRSWCCSWLKLPKVSGMFLSLLTVSAMSALISKRCRLCRRPRSVGKLSMSIQSIASRWSLIKLPKVSGNLLIPEFSRFSFVKQMRSPNDLGRYSRLTQ